MAGRIFSAEWLKYRRTATMWLLALTPAGLVAALAWYSSATGRSDSWSDFLGPVYESWAMLCVPAGAALLAGLAVNYEEQVGGWHALRARPVPVGALYGGKLSVLAIHALISTLLLNFLTGIAGTILGAHGPVPWGTLFLAGVLCWIAALPQLAFQLWVAAARGFGASIAVGIPGLLIAALIGGTGLGSGVWPAVPWAWPPGILGAALNLAENGSRQISSGPGPEFYVATITGLALALSAALSVAGLLWFDRQECG